MEYDAGKDSDNEIDSKTTEKQKLNLSHEDLSDVSDLDSIGAASDDEHNSKKDDTEVTKVPNDLRLKLEEAKNRKLNDKQPTNPPEKTSKTEDGEEQLDFEAEDGECVEEAKTKSVEEDTGPGVHETEPDEKTKEEKEEVILINFFNLFIYIWFFVC